MAAGPQQSVKQSSTFSGSASELRKQQVDKAHLARQRQQLHLQRENILGQRTSNPNRRVALEAALKQIEAQIQALD